MKKKQKAKKVIVEATLFEKLTDVISDVVRDLRKRK